MLIKKMEMINKFNINEGLVDVRYVSFTKRFSRSCFNYGSVFLIFIAIYSFLYISLGLGLSLLLFLIYYIYKIYNESITYVVEIFVKSDNVVLKYYIKDAGPILLKIPVEKFSVEWFDVVKGNINAAKIIFKENNSNVLVQWMTGEWSRQRIEEVYKCLNLNH